jgi:hypothetical protein
MGRNKMIQELTALQEDMLLEDSLERWRETKQAREEAGKKYCEFCNAYFDEVFEVKVDNNEKVNLCEGCRQELYEFGQEEYEREVLA